MCLVNVYYMDEAINLTHKLISCRSVTPSDDGAIQLIGAELTSYGFDVDIFENSTPDGWSVTNLYASYDSGEGPVLAFAGHVDVVPVGNILNWDSDPFSAMNLQDKIFGRGVSDMKGAIAAFMIAAKNFISNNSFNGKLVFLITSDEEEGSPQGMRSIINWCIRNNKIPTHCLIGEPTCRDSVTQHPIINIGRRGSISFKVISHGTQGHVAYSEFAANAINPLISFLNTIMSKRFDEEDPGFPQTSLQITSIAVDNDVSNVIPGHAEATFNVRFNRKYSLESLIGTFANIASLVSNSLEIISFPSGEAFLCDDTSFVNMLSESIDKVLKIKPEISTGGSTSDGRFLINYCPIIEFGLTYNSIHKENEFAYQNDIIKLQNIYEEFLVTFFNQ